MRSFFLALWCIFHQCNTARWYVHAFVIIAPKTGKVVHRVQPKQDNVLQQQQQQLAATSSNNQGNKENGMESVTTSESSSRNSDPDVIAKASWYAAEAFGKVFGRQSETDKNSNYDLAAQPPPPPKTVSETIQRLQIDNARAYFLSGLVDVTLYDPNCVFADPFVSFVGRDRFVENLRNLGSFIVQYSAKPLLPLRNDDDDDSNRDDISSTTTAATTVYTTKFMVKLELNLPWKPVLAWPWGVRCTIDPTTNLIVRHEESWDIEPWEGVKQIFRKPTTKV